VPDSALDPASLTVFKRPRSKLFSSMDALFPDINNSLALVGIYLAIVVQYKTVNAKRYNSSLVLIRS
jgi:hypothetical protein